MDIIPVNKDVAIAFEKMASSLNHSKVELMHAFLVDAGTWTEDYAVLNDADFDTWVALIYGSYEIQKTPHEIIRERYVYVMNSYKNSSFAEGMLFILEALGEQVEGVNYFPPFEDDADEMPEETPGEGE